MSTSILPPMLRAFGAQIEDVAKSFDQLPTVKNAFFQLACGMTTLGNSLEIHRRTSILDGTHEMFTIPSKMLNKDFSIITPRVNTPLEETDQMFRRTRFRQFLNVLFRHLMLKETDTSICHFQLTSPEGLPSVEQCGGPVEAIHCVDDKTLTFVWTDSNEAFNHKLVINNAWQAGVGSCTYTATSIWTEETFVIRIDEVIDEWLFQYLQPTLAFSFGIPENSYDQTTLEENVHLVDALFEGIPAEYGFISVTIVLEANPLDYVPALDVSLVYRPKDCIGDKPASFHVKVKQIDSTECPGWNGDKVSQVMKWDDLPKSTHEQILAQLPAARDRYAARFVKQ